MVKEDSWRIIGDLLDTTKVRKFQAKGVEVIDSRIEHLLTQFDFEFDVVTISELAMKLNVSQIRKRAPWVYKLLELDRSFGPGGYTLIFRRRTFGFGQLLKYDAIYRPMKYVYLPFGLTYCPACWSRDIAENACAHVEQCVRLYLTTKNIPVKPKATLGHMLGRNQSEFSLNIFNCIKSLNNFIYGRTKHEFKIELPREQLLSLTESLIVYFVSRILGLTLLRECGVLSDIVDEIERGRTEEDIFIGQEFFI